MNHLLLRNSGLFFVLNLPLNVFKTKLLFQHPCDGIKCAEHEICIVDRQGPCLATITRDGDVVECPQHRCGKKTDNFASAPLCCRFIKHDQYSNQSKESWRDLYQSHHRKKLKPIINWLTRVFPPRHTGYNFLPALHLAHFPTRILTLMLAPALCVLVLSLDWFNASLESVVIGQRQTDVTVNFRCGVWSDIHTYTFIQIFWKGEFGG